MSTNTRQGCAFRRRDLIALEHQAARQQAHDRRMVGRRRVLAAAVILPSLAGGVMGLSTMVAPTLAQAATVTAPAQTTAGGASYTDAATGQVWSLNAFTGQVTTGSLVTFDVNAKNTIASPATLTLLTAAGTPASTVTAAAGTFTVSGGTVVFQGSLPGTATVQYSYTELSGKDVTSTLTVTVADPTWKAIDLGQVAQGASASVDAITANPGDLTDAAQVVLRSLDGTAGGLSLVTPNGAWEVGADHHTITFTAAADATPGAQDQVLYGVEGSEVTGTATVTIAQPAPPDNGGGDQGGTGTNPGTGDGGGGSTNPDHGGGTGSGTGSDDGSTGGGTGTGTGTTPGSGSGTGDQTTPITPPVVAPTVTPAESITAQTVGSTIDLAAAPGGLLTAQAGQAGAASGALSSDAFASATQGAALTPTGENPAPEASSTTPSHRSHAKQSKHAQMEVSASPVSHPAQTVWLWVSSLGLAIAIAAVGLLVFFRRHKTGGQHQ
jgi:hypothetical protein